MLFSRGLRVDILALLLSHTCGRNDAGKVLSSCMLPRLWSPRGKYGTSGNNEIFALTVLSETWQSQADIIPFSTQGMVSSLEEWSVTYQSHTSIEEILPSFVYLFAHSLFMEKRIIWRSLSVISVFSTTWCQNSFLAWWQHCKLSEHAKETS